MDCIQRALSDKSDEPNEGEAQPPAAPPQVPPRAPAPGPLPLYRENTPINEFDANDRLIIGGFPTLFVLGQKLPSTSSLPQSFLKHLMNQHDLQFAQNSDLLFILFNQMQWHAAARGASACVKSSNGTPFVHLVISDGFDQELQAPVHNPQLATSKTLAQKLSSYVNTTGGSVPWGPAERSKSLSKMLALCYHFNLPSFFITVSPADMNSPILLRLAKHFPGIPSVQNLINYSSLTGSLQ